MTSLGWLFIVVGAIVNFLAKPFMERVLKKQAGDGVLYIVKTIGLCLVILGAAMIFLAGGKI